MCDRLSAFDGSFFVITSEFQMPEEDLVLLCSLYAGMLYIYGHLQKIHRRWLISHFQDMKARNILQNPALGTYSYCLPFFSLANGVM